MESEGLTSEQYNAANPYWNRVWLVPVVTSTNSSNVVTSVQHDFSLCSAPRGRHEGAVHAGDL